MFGGGHGSYKIEGIGNDFVPKTMDISFVDKVIKVNDEEAFEKVRLLAKKEGLIVGSSSGAIRVAAMRLLQEINHGNIVIVFSDRWDRYLSTTLFDD